MSRFRRPPEKCLLLSGPKNLHRIFLNHRVRSDEDHVFQVGLSNQQSIEGIMMVVRQAEDRQGMLVRNR